MTQTPHDGSRMTESAQRATSDLCAALRLVGGRGRPVAGAADAAAAIEELVTAAGGERAVLYEPCAESERLGLPLALAARGIRLVEVGTSRGRTADLRVALTGAELAIAGSGSLLVGGRPGGWGLAAVLPWVHVVVLRDVDIRPDLAAAFPEFRARFEAGERDWVWITGPSKTADIAKTLVTGIHGPNALEVLVTASGAPANAGPEPA